MDKPAKKLLRCAIYTRKSTDHILDLEFNSLDQLRAGSLVLDQDDCRVEQSALPGDGALEAGIVEFFAQDVRQVKMRSLDAPGRANGIIGEFGRLGRGVPALNDLIEGGRPILWIVTPEPAFFDQACASLTEGSPDSLALGASHHRATLCLIFNGVCTKPDNFAHNFTLHA
jgi:hypothetical protein